MPWDANVDITSVIDSKSAGSQFTCVTITKVPKHDYYDTDAKAQPSLRALSTTQCKRARKLSCQKAGGSRFFFFSDSIRKKKSLCFICP
jgi:hypothetical protein